MEILFGDLGPRIVVLSILSTCLMSALLMVALVAICRTSQLLKGKGKGKGK